MTSLRRTRKILSVLLAVSLFCGAAFSQSLRRSQVRIASTIKAGDASQALQQAESDQYVGRVVFVEGFSVAVLAAPYTLFGGWENFYYACDERLNAVAVLKATQTSHRNCRIYELAEGSVRRGDRVFIKQIPPRKSEEQEAPKPAL